MPLVIDPNPCLLYPWSEARCTWEPYSGSHACRYSAGHEGLCCCATCEEVGFHCGGVLSADATASPVAPGVP